MLTQILRDSLGGNCKTTMIANISIDKSDITESVSTLKFSQNVASIKNDYRVNEEQDPSLVIKRLRKEIDTLKNEIKLLKG
jgi:kinesin family protein 6/9